MWARTPNELLLARPWLSRTPLRKSDYGDRRVFNVLKRGVFLPNEKRDAYSSGLHPDVLEALFGKKGIDWESVKRSALAKSRTAYLAVPEHDGFRLGLAEHDSPGYCPLDERTYATYDEAVEAAEQRNRKEYGLTEAEAHVIVTSSMAAQNRKERERRLTDDERAEVRKEILGEVFFEEDVDDVWEKLELDEVSNIYDAYTRFDLWKERDDARREGKEHKRCPKCKKGIEPGIDEDCPECGEDLRGERWRK
jgi:hypothetical protein